MTLVYEIINDAFRESNLVAIGQTPTLAEQTEALRLLNRFVRSVLNGEAGELLSDLSVTDSTLRIEPISDLFGYFPEPVVPSNTRLVANLTEPTELLLEPEPQDGARVSVVDAGGNLATFNLTLNGNGRKIGGANTAVLSTNSLQQEWFYRADLGSWELVSDLTLNSSFPFPVEFEDFFVISLATRINPRQGVALDEQTVANYRRQKSMFNARYSQSYPQPSERGLYMLTRTL